MINPVYELVYSFQPIPGWYSTRLAAMWALTTHLLDTPTSKCPRTMTTTVGRSSLLLSLSRIRPTTKCNLKVRKLTAAPAKDRVLNWHDASPRKHELAYNWREEDRVTRT
ncbi:hypothetical protein M430DRAFT_62624 [Amorphotheca resinae ATCC 22711]|uniref:Uncharacterized protein n=1 Tax=Amorphotheca resinae ATCC 22711 TaxID=857342 RepID=A0A2T3BD92_AMORE|nr:hypothetical protein M430DRAFT_62624 [Amorphotheca resinae ATCC 22711]PSS27377.1 hypothetical protein M430DRAFT_62624 [Amorphotheca resinae ATCC 22711]